MLASRVYFVCEGGICFGMAGSVKGRKGFFIPKPQKTSLARTQEMTKDTAGNTVSSLVNGFQANKSIKTTDGNTVGPINRARIQHLLVDTGQPIDKDQSIKRFFMKDDSKMSLKNKTLPEDIKVSGSIAITGAQDTLLIEQGSSDLSYTISHPPFNNTFNSQVQKNLFQIYLKAPETIRKFIGKEAGIEGATPTIDEEALNKITAKMAEWVSGAELDEGDGESKEFKLHVTLPQGYGDRKSNSEIKVDFESEGLSKVELLTRDTASTDGYKSSLVGALIDYEKMTEGDAKLAKSMSDGTTFNQVTDNHLRELVGITTVTGASGKTKASMTAVADYSSGTLTVGGEEMQGKFYTFGSRGGKKEVFIDSQGAAYSKDGSGQQWSKIERKRTKIDNGYVTPKGSLLFTTGSPQKKITSNGDVYVGKFKGAPQKFDTTEEFILTRPNGDRLEGNGDGEFKYTSSTGLVCEGKGVFNLESAQGCLFELDDGELMKITPKPGGPTLIRFAENFSEEGVVQARPGDDGREPFTIKSKIQDGRLVDTLIPYNPYDAAGGVGGKMLGQKEGVFYGQDGLSIMVTHEGGVLEVYDAIQESKVTIEKGSTIEEGSTINVTKKVVHSMDGTDGSAEARFEKTAISTTYKVDQQGLLTETSTLTVKAGQGSLVWEGEVMFSSGKGPLQGQLIYTPPSGDPVTLKASKEEDGNFTIEHPHMSVKKCTLTIDEGVFDLSKISTPNITRDGIEEIALDNFLKIKPNVDHVQEAWRGFQEQFDAQLALSLSEDDAGRLLAQEADSSQPTPREFQYFNRMMDLLRISAGDRFGDDSTNEAAIKTIFKDNFSEIDDDAVVEEIYKFCKTLLGSAGPEVDGRSSAVVDNGKAPLVQLGEVRELSDAQTDVIFDAWCESLLQDGSWLTDQELMLIAEAENKSLTIDIKGADSGFSLKPQYEDGNKVTIVNEGGGASSGAGAHYSRVEDGEAQSTSGKGAFCGWHSVCGTKSSGGVWQVGNIDAQKRSTVHKMKEKFTGDAGFKARFKGGLAKEINSNTTREHLGARQIAKRNLEVLAKRDQDRVEVPVTGVVVDRSGTGSPKKADKVHKSLDSTYGTRGKTVKINIADIETDIERSSTNFNSPDFDFGPVFEAINEVTIDQNYQGASDIRTIGGQKVNRPNHNGTHAARQARLTQMALDDPDHQHLFKDFTDREKNLLIMTAFLMRAGRQDESGGHGDDYFSRGADILDAYLTQISPAITDVEKKFYKDLLLSSAAPESQRKKKKLDEHKGSRKFFKMKDLLTTVHRLDVMRCKKLQLNSAGRNLRGFNLDKYKGYAQDLLATTGDFRFVDCNQGNQAGLRIKLAYLGEEGVRYDGKKYPALSKSGSDCWKACQGIKVTYVGKTYN
ncbi:hypothetical protein DID78_03935 [Candidatus Marinamargulisbacteria bacterium SCGC AG-343-D04]|nr:hypothetical protein DID78_03935 [Candidatus Marinamargulisbacteria bacterium SCGC AG-343-D04]